MLPKNWNKCRGLCQVKGYHEYEPASPLDYGSYSRGRYECRVCGRLTGLELIKPWDIVYSEIDYGKYFERNI